MRRRSYLAVMGAGLLTGCNALGGKKFAKAEQPFSNVQNASGLDKGDVGKSAHVELKKGRYANFSFTAQEQSKMDITGQVMENGPIDIYVMTIDQFNQYQRKPNLIPSKMEAEQVKSIDISSTIQPNDYLLVFDNTMLGGAKPSGKAVVEFEFVLSGTGSNGNGNTTTTQS
ncbi:MAG: hypothetical protein ABEI77_05590 [Halorientalis sp.]